MRLSQTPELALHVGVDQLLVAYVLKQLCLVVQRHAREIRIAPLRKFLGACIEQIILLLRQHLQSVIMPLLQVRDAPSHFANSFALKRQILVELALVSLQKLRDLLHLRTPVGEGLHGTLEEELNFFLVVPHLVCSTDLKVIART